MFTVLCRVPTYRLPVLQPERNAPGHEKEEVDVEIDGQVPAAVTYNLPTADNKALTPG